MNLFESVQFVIEDFLSTPLPERLEKLGDELASEDKELANHIRNIKTKVEEMDINLGTTTYKDGKGKTTIAMGGDSASRDVVANEDGSVSMPSVMFYVDLHIESNVLRAIRALLKEQMIEALIGANWTPEKYQEHLRLAAGLKMELSGDTKDFLTCLHRRLSEDKRTKWMNIHPGGSKSLLVNSQGNLAGFYERAHPIWKQAKKIYTKHGGGKKGEEAVKREYHTWSPYIEGTLGAQNPNPNYIGLPDKLIKKLNPEREDATEYDSSPEYIANEHAAFLCGFKIGEYSVRQIKAAIRAYKKIMGIEYYNHLYKGKPMRISGRSN